MNSERLQAGERLFHSSDPAPAAVVGASLVSFGQGLSPQDREDICLSNLYAQLATRSAYQDGLVGSWFNYYRNTLRYLGWDSAAWTGGRGVNGRECCPANLPVIR